MSEMYAIVYQGRSRIGSLMPDCVVEEVHEDRTQITAHPVERGSNISDHAFLLPQQLEMRIAWADYKGGSNQHSSMKYEQLQKLQADLEPLKVTTGKRSYKDMMIESVSVTHDEKTKNAVIAIVRLREVRFAESVFNIGALPSNQLYPHITQPRTSAGPIDQTKTKENPTVSKNSPPDAAQVILPPPDLDFSGSAD